MRSFLKMAIVGAAAAMAATPASAATFIFDFSGSSGVNGPDGNGRIFSATNGPDTVNVRASGWSIASDNIVRDSFLGAFGGGLGVTSGDDGDGSGARHTTDNQNRIDFILLQFDQIVQLDSAQFNSFSLGGSTDNDATIGFGSTAIAWNSQPNLNNQNVSALDALIPEANRIASLGNGSNAIRQINLAENAGNLWLIAAATSSDNPGGIDAFKFNTLAVQNVQGVPEPGTWAMMIFGFGMIGSALRRRKEKVAVSYS